MAEHSPTPWRVADIDHDYDIIDADGKVVARAAHGDRALAGYIADAVNLYSQIDAARTDSDGNRHLLQMEGKPVVIITPPPSEAEVVRMYRDQIDSLYKDRIMFERAMHMEHDRGNRYLDLVRRLAQRLQMARLEGFGVPERDTLLDEAREALRREKL